MTNPKNTGDQELSLDQLSDAAGGAAFMKLGDIKGEATDQAPLEEINIDSFELDKSSTKYNPGKGASVNWKGDGYTEVEWTY